MSALTITADGDNAVIGGTLPYLGDVFIDNMTAWPFEILISGQQQAFVCTRVEPFSTETVTVLDGSSLRIFRMDGK